ncbi:hypothetical protein TNCV_475041 [Trichonephila clavipes]|nr:hypothetical protein TNCV_475041 [Trichonephila clavipes]
MRSRYRSSHVDVTFRRPLPVFRVVRCSSGHLLPNSYHCGTVPLHRSSYYVIGIFSFSKAENHPSFKFRESTIRAIKKNEAAIRKSVISGTKLSTKFTLYTRDVLLERTERAIAVWIEEQVQRRIPVSGYLIQEKDLQFYKSMKQSEPSTSTSQAGKEFQLAKDG